MLSALRAVCVALSCCCSACALWGGSERPPVVVKVPVAVRAEPPVELLRCTNNLPRPVFKNCSGESCLNEREEARLRELLYRLMSCERGWQAWTQKN